MNFTKKDKLMTIGIGAVVVMLIFFIVIGMIIGASNTAISYEEDVIKADSAVKVQLKRREDLIINLANVVSDYASNEKETYTQIAELKNSNKSSATAINALAEAYPELKADTLYKELMTELSMTENLIAQHRDTFNNHVRVYTKYIRKFPTRVWLDIMDYEKINAKYLDFDVSDDAPVLFGGNK